MARNGPPAATEAALPSPPLPWPFSRPRAPVPPAQTHAEISTACRLMGLYVDAPFSTPSITLSAAPTLAAVRAAALVAHLRRLVVKGGTIDRPTFYDRSSKVGRL